MAYQYLKTSSWATLCYTASAAMSKVVTFFMLPYFLSNISLEEFGTWDWYHGWSVSIVSLGSGLSIVALPRFIARYSGIEQRYAISNCLYAGLIASALVALCAVPILLTNYSVYLLYTIGIICCSIPFTIGLSYCSSLQYVWWYSAIGLVHQLLSSCLSAVFMWQGYATYSFFAAHCISLLIFLPLFIGLLYYYPIADFSIAYQQFLYSAPIVIHGFIHTLFYLIDRSALRSWCSPTDLGSYALLLRFSALFQILALSITNVWPVVCFKAYQKSSPQKDVAKIINYFSFLLWIGYFGAYVGTIIGVHLFFSRYMFIIPYISLFLMTPLLLSLAQLYTVGTMLNNTTLHLPFLTAITALIQYGLFYLLKPHHLQSVMLINCIPFLLYMLCNALISCIYIPCSIDYKRVTMLHSISGIFALLISIFLPYAWCLISTVALSGVWFLIILMLLFRQEVSVIKDELVKMILKD